MRKKHGFPFVLSVLLSVAASPARGENNPFILLNTTSGEAYFYHDQYEGTVAGALNRGYLTEVLAAYGELLARNGADHAAVLKSIALLPQGTHGNPTLLLEATTFLEANGYEDPSMMERFLTLVDTHPTQMNNHATRVLIYTVAEVADQSHFEGMEKIRTHAIDMLTERLSYTPKDRYLENAVESILFDIDAKGTPEETIGRPGVHTKNVMTEPGSNFTAYLTPSFKPGRPEPEEPGLKAQLSIGKLRVAFLEAMAEQPAIPAFAGVGRTSLAYSKMIQAMSALLQPNDLELSIRAGLLGEFLATAGRRGRVDVVPALVVAAKTETLEGLTGLEVFLAESNKGVQEVIQILLDPDVELREERIIGDPCPGERAEMALVIRAIANVRDPRLAGSVNLALAAIPRLLSAGLLPNDLATTALLQKKPSDIFVTIISAAPKMGETGSFKEIADAKGVQPGTGKVKELPGATQEEIIRKKVRESIRKDPRKPKL